MIEIQSPVQLPDESFEPAIESSDSADSGDKTKEEVAAVSNSAETPGDAVEVESTATEKPEPKPSAEPKPDATTQVPEPETTAAPEPDTTVKPEPTTTSKPEPPTTQTPNDPIPKKPVHNHLEILDPDNKKALCFMADLDLSFEVRYNNSDDDLQKQTVNVPEIQNKSSVVILMPGCSKNSTLKVPFAWFWDSAEWNVTLTFKAGNETYNLSGVEAHFPNDPNFFPSIKTDRAVLSFYNDSVVDAPVTLGHAYKCNSVEYIIVQPSLTMVVSNLKFQAFSFPVFSTSSTSGGGEYSMELDVCLEDKPESKLIPIIVGCVLAGLIVLVLIAYIIASRRYKTYTGYETL